MPLVEVPDVGTVEFPDDMTHEQIVSAIEDDIYAKRQPSLKPAMTEPGVEGPLLASKPVSDLPTQAFPTTPQPAPERQPKFDQLTEEELLLSGGKQMPPKPEAQVELPRFGEPGTITRGVSDIAAGLGEWALNKPEEFVGTLLNPAVKAAVELRYAPEIAVSFAKDVAAGFKGDKEAIGRALAIFAAVATPKAAQIGKQTIAEAKARTEIQGETASLNDFTARQRLNPENAQVRLPEQPALPTTAAELKTGTDPNSVTFANGPDRGERGKLLKSMRPTVPETPPEPQRNLTVLEEIRQRGADTRRKVQAMFPHLSNEEAAALRDQAFPKQKTPEPVPKNEEVQAKEPVQPAEAEATPELPSRPSNDAGKPPAEAEPVPDVKTNRFGANPPWLNELKKPENADILKIWESYQSTGNLDARDILTGGTRGMLLRLEDVREMVRDYPSRAEKAIQSAEGIKPEPAAAPKPKPAPPAEEVPLRDLSKKWLRDFEPGDVVTNHGREYTIAKQKKTSTILSDGTELSWSADSPGWKKVEAKPEPAPEITPQAPEEAPLEAPKPEAPKQPEQTAPAEKKIAKQVKEVAVEEGPRAATEIKSELISRIDSELESLPKAEAVELFFGKPSTYQGKQTITARLASESMKRGLQLVKDKDGTWRVEISDYLPEGKNPATIRQTLAKGMSLEEAKRVAINQVAEGNKFHAEKPITRDGKEFTPDIKKMESLGFEFRPDPGTVTIDIPGDGTFTIPKTRAALERIRARAKALETSTKPPKGYTESVPTRKEGQEYLKEAKIEPPESETGIAGASPPSQPGAPIPPSSTPVIAKTPKSQRQIITDIAKGLKLPIRFGRLITPRYGGYFMKVQDLIASKFANDVPVVTHEAGHKLDAEFGFSGEAALRRELDVLGDPATPGSMSSWTRHKSMAYKMGEGVAEFTRYWMIDPAKAKNDAPNVYRRFEEVLDANKDFGDVMRQAQEDIRLWRTAQPQARFRSHISVGDNPNGTRYTLSQLTRDTLDDLHFFRLATDDAMRYRTAPLEPSRDIYKQARLLRGSYGMADTFVRDGVVDFNTREVKIGTSLEDALKPVAGRLDDFRDYIVAKRALELESQGRKTGFLVSDINSVIAAFDKDPVFRDTFQKVKDWQDALLQYAVDAGLVTDAGAKAMRRMNEDYVPFHRIFEVGAGEASAVQGGGVGKGMNVGTPGSLRKLKGSARDIVDPLETMVKNAYTLITAAEKAHIHASLSDYANMPKMGKWVERIGTPKDQIKVGLEKIRKQLEDEGADLTNVPDDLLLTFYQNSGRAPFGENTIRIVRDGQPEFYRLDKDLFDTFHALDLEDAGAFVRAWSQGAQVLRAGVVLEPSFALANAIRDTVSAAVLSKYNALPFEVTLRGLGAIMRNPKLVAEWAASGGKNSVEAAYFDREKMQKILRERISKDLTPSEKALVVVRSPLTALRWLTEKAEEATRIGEYQKAFNKLVKSGMPEGEARRLAAFEARDRQDFAKGGAKTKIIRRITPFWNAALQANVKLASSLKNNPARTIMQGIAFVTIPKLLEQAVNYDDPDYWDRPQWERDLFFMIPFGKDPNGHTKFIRIPTPFEIGIMFGTLPGRVIQYGKQNADPATESYMSTLLKGAMPNIIPPVEKTIIETALTGKQGWDIYRGRTIVPDRLADLPADMQWTEQNSLLAKKLGKMLGLSPMKIDHAIRGTTGGIGQQVTHNVIDPMISAATGEESTASGKYPGSRFISTPAGVMSQSVETFYANLSKINGESQRQKITGKAEDYVLLQKDFNRAAEQMSELRKAARQTTDKNLQQLYQLQIADLAKDMNRLAREFGLK